MSLYDLAEKEKPLDPKEKTRLDYFKEFMALPTDKPLHFTALNYWSKMCRTDPTILEFLKEVAKDTESWFI